MCRVVAVLCLTFFLSPLQVPAQPDFPEPTLRVTALEASQSGFTARFNRNLDVNVLNIYDGPDSPQEAPDLVLLDETSQPVQGSLLWKSSENTLRFLKTGSPLEPGSYTLILYSRPDAFADFKGEPLDGDADGNPGADFVTGFRVDPSPARVISIPDFAAAPAQAVNIPFDVHGLPVFIDDANNVTDIMIHLAYNPSLLTVHNVNPGCDIPIGWACVFSSPEPGVLTISASGSRPVPPGKHEIFQISATVPPDARPGSRQMIEFTLAELNSGAIPVRTDQALHLIAKPGDATNDGQYAADDAALIAGLAVGEYSGLDAYQQIDPVVICDVSGNGAVNARDASLVAQKAESVTDLQAQSLALPDVLDTSAGVSSVSITTNNFILHGQAKDIPVYVDDAAEMLALDATVLYDTNLLDVLPGDVNVGNLLADWAIFANVEDAKGKIRIAAFGIIPLAPGVGDGNLLVITFREPNNSGGGVSELNITGELDEGLIPADFHDGAAIVCCVPGDYDYDCDIDLKDFSSFAMLWRQNDCAHCQGRDFNGDQKVNFGDLADFATRWLTP